MSVVHIIMIDLSLYMKPTLDLSQQREISKSSAAVNATNNRNVFYSQFL